MILCGLGGVCVKALPAVEELTQQEVAELFKLSTQLNNGKLIVHGLFARADAKTTNGRIYPKAILKREVRRYRRQHVQQGTALGELNHPSYYSNYFRNLNLPNVSHQVLDVYWRGRELWGTIEVLPTPAGLLLWELYSKGVKFGVSSRGWASVVLDPATEQLLVDKDLQLITFDFVTEPSNAGAFLVPVDYKYRKQLPDQSHVVRVSYLGIGSSAMSQLKQIPEATALSSWLKQTRMAAAAAQQLVVTDDQQQEQQLSACLPPPAPFTNSLLRQPSVAVAVACSAHPPDGDSLLADANQLGCASLTHGAACNGVGVAAADNSSFLTALRSNRACFAAPFPPSTCLGGGVQLGCHYRVLDEPWLPVDPAGRDFKVHLSLVATKAHLLQQKQERTRQQRQQQLPQQQCEKVQQQQAQKPSHDWLVCAQQWQSEEGAGSKAAVGLVPSDLQQVPTSSGVDDQLAINALDGKEAQLQQHEGLVSMLPLDQHAKLQPQPQQLLSADDGPGQGPDVPPAEAVGPVNTCHVESCSPVAHHSQASADGSSNHSLSLDMQPIAEQQQQQQHHAAADAAQGMLLREQCSCMTQKHQQQVPVLHRRSPNRTRIAPALSGAVD